MKTTEKRNPLSIGIDEKSTLEILMIMNREDRRIAGIVEAQIPTIAEAVEAVASTLRSGGRVILLGAGSSGRLGVLEAAELPPTFGLPPESFQAIIAGCQAAVHGSVESAEDSPEAGASAVRQADVSGRDILIALTASGSTPYVLGGVEEARSRGAGSIGITCNRGTELDGLVDIPIVLEVGPEIVAGSTRLRAATAQKMALNMITTASMVRLGRVHDGYMVGVQTSNAKLRERATRIIAEATGATREEARAFLEEADGDVRAAILIAKTGMTPWEAREALGEWRSIRDVLWERREET